MSCKLSDVLYETKNFFVLRVPKGYEVYKTGITHSTRCAQIGWPDSETGLNKAIAETDRRQKQYNLADSVY